MTHDFRAYAADEILRDGGSIHLRAIRPDDKQRLLDHFGRLSPRSIHFRFFGAKRRLTEEELVRFTEPDFVKHVGLVATLHEGEAERIIGVGRYFATAPERAEVAFAVADEHQGRGIGTVLLEHLAPLARANGISEFEADVLGENNRMLQVFRKSGFVVRRSREAGVVHVSFATAETDELQEASLERDLHASAESVRFALRPRAIAVVLDDDGEGTSGRAVLDNLRRAAFAGEVHPVHPTAAEIGGWQAHASVAAIGKPIDLCVVAVAAPVVFAAVEDCARAGVHAVAVLSAGFAETSADGARVQADLVRLARRSGMRLIGPNCLGVINTDPAVRLNATDGPFEPVAGGIGMLSQSGAVGLALLDFSATRGLGISTFVSVGNKADVSGNDLLAYWRNDPATSVVALYLQSFGNPRRFARIAPRVARVKPVVVVKSGRSTSSAPAAGDEGGVWAQVDVAVDALFQQAGVIRTDSLEELFGVLTLLGRQPVPLGSGVGIVTNGRGPGALLADACMARSLLLPRLEPSTASALSSLLGSEAAAANPVDIRPAVDPAAYEGAIAAIGADPNVDAVIAVHAPTLPSSAVAAAAAIARGAAEVAVEKPVVAVFLSSAGAPAALHEGGRGVLPAFAFPESAAHALAAAARYGRWRRRPPGTALDLDRTATSVIRAVVDRVREEGDGDPVRLEPRDLAAVLVAAGIQFAETHATGPEDAAALASTLGFPLVAKAVAPGLGARGDAGCVILGLESAAQVEEAVALLRSRVAARGLSLEGVLLQREHGGGVEAIVGVRSDPLFGPLVACGLGGVLVEVVRDVAVRLTPLTDLDAAEMIDSLRASRLLRGYRGIGPGDRAALEAILLRVSALVEAVPELRGLELNPIAVLPPGRGAVVLDGWMEIGRRQ